ncbi:MAG: bifunctional (p)ppGpp synthetase/guanosine-3',5'-bis(diphosphate) 3'-pyrophosphohydrolase [Nitrospinae bacterium CG11_big_fil_rev_8_21_14_0_20_56_8]|nr:MAG: bifunctional (p)ppGpp synthetase/guanosine-3',5'-bis(diphosphate) 3'-pyrophosphohydrolase [Nitrospinae bacterium CG11_big_fil_rev_8_21_14_0_20_56_8]
MRKLSDITDAILEYHPNGDVDIILDAYLLSAKAHRNQSRKSGEAYFSHPVEVAWNLTRLKMDEKAVAAGLLHDTLEDTLTTPEEIIQSFGEEVYQLVDGVTKISKIHFSSQEETQAENYRKMILAMSKDIRVVLIKLGDRAHNLQTLGSLHEDRQKRIARETLDIYAPIANRLGIGWLKAELEDGAFKYLHPAEYQLIKKKVAAGRAKHEKFVKRVCQLVMDELAGAEIQGAVQGRTKHYYGIFKKMMGQDIGFDDVYDLIGVRVLTHSVKDCYAVLGLIHALWKPIPGRFKDYIAMPKPNGYQSLHTTVIGPEGERVEVQIRTEEMHSVCEEGIAAHWQYKESDKAKPKPAGQGLVWVRHLLESQKDFKNPKEFLHAFKVDLFSNEVYVFTPRGEVVALPRGSTPVDFAYSVHTDIGDHCQTCRVNGKIVPLRYKLRNGDQVEVVTSKLKNPNRDWLSFVKTSKARSRVSNYINSQERARSLLLGKELIEKEIRELGLDPEAVLKAKNLDEAIHASGFGNMESMLRGIGIGKISAIHVIERLVPRDKLEKKKPAEAATLKLKTHEAPKTEGPIKVKCLNEDILLRVGKCCNPVPGDPIVGYITRGRGVTVHHLECPSVSDLGSEPERLIEVEWGAEKKTAFPVRISIVAEDKPGQLAEISNAIARFDVNITRANVQQGPSKRAYFDFFIEIHDLNQLNHTLNAITRVQGVIHVERVKEYKKKVSGKNTLDGRVSDTSTTEGRELRV